ncbi:uncharacterized protein DMENIID0001_013540 [Sergentomyia squamirostris]
MIAKLNQIDINEDIFDGLGELKNFEYDVELIENPKFVIHAAHEIPMSKKKAIKKELDNMVKKRVIHKCREATDAVSPMVPVERIDQVATRVAGSKRFSKIDQKNGFWQIKLSPRTSKLCTFATPWGRYSYDRLPFGISSAPELFQLIIIMSEMFEGLEGVEVSMDDILLHAPTEEKLKEITDKVFRILKENGLKLNKDKCVFNQPMVTFLGHKLSAEGLHPDESKIEAIEKLQRPHNVKSLQRFLGMVNYLGKFIQNLSDLTAWHL